VLGLTFLTVVASITWSVIQWLSRR
jgi:hypothetical protein